MASFAARRLPAAVVSMLLLAACPADVADAPALDFHIEPAVGAIAPGSSIHYLGVNNATGATVPVSWRLGNPQFGLISADGVLSIPHCGTVTNTTLTALLVADTTHTASLELIQGAIAATAPLSISTMSYVLSGAPATVDSLAGNIDVGILLSPDACGEITQVELRVTQAGATATVASAAPAPRATLPAVQVLRWNADALPNGPATIMVVAVGPVVQFSSPALSVTIKH
jgi:hypothetical protein